MATRAQDSRRLLSWHRFIRMSSRAYWRACTGAVPLTVAGSCSGFWSNTFQPLSRAFERDHQGRSDCSRSPAAGSRLLRRGSCGPPVAGEFTSRHGKTPTTSSEERWQDSLQNNEGFWIDNLKTRPYRTPSSMQLSEGNGPSSGGRRGRESCDLRQHFGGCGRRFSERSRRRWVIRGRPLRRGYPLVSVNQPIARPSRKCAVCLSREGVA